MEPKVNYVLVGLFVLVLGAILLGVGLWLGKGDYQATYDRYYAFMRESVAGLSVNAPVKYHGVEVGYVVEIVLNPENPEEVRLTLDIVRGAPIKENTVATLRVQGLTGFAIVDLTGGTRDSPALTAKPDKPYPVIKTRPSFFVRLEETGTRLLVNLNQVLDETRAVMDTDSRVALKQILSDLARLTRALPAQSERLDEGLISVAEAAKNLSRMTRSVDEQLPALMEQLEQSALAVQDMSEEVGHTSRAVGEMVDQARPNVEQFSRQTLAETGLLVAELRELTATLNRVARQLETEPESMIFGRRPPPRGPGE